MKIRDFIYMDVERLKSIIAQVEEGFSDTATTTKAETQETGFGLESGLFGFLKGDIDSKFLWEDQQSETRSLHDYIYNKVESALLEHELLLRIPGDVTDHHVATDSVPSIIASTSFILARGRVGINDYPRMRAMLSNFNDLGKFFTRASLLSLAAHVSNQEKQRIAKQSKENRSMDRELLKGFELLFDVLYPNRTIVKLTAFPDHADFRLVGNLKPEHLRDDVDSIIFKYGTAPEADWAIFGQVASIPSESPVPEPDPTRGSELDMAFHGMFSALREIERMAQSVVFPEIAITPIAIYRE